jgi:hypothetical protein
MKTDEHGGLANGILHLGQVEGELLALAPAFIPPASILCEG